MTPHCGNRSKNNEVELRPRANAVGKCSLSPPLVTCENNQTLLLCDLPQRESPPTPPSFHGLQRGIAACHCSLPRMINGSSISARLIRSSVRLHTSTHRLAQVNLRPWERPGYRHALFHKPESLLGTPQ